MEDPTVTPPAPELPTEAPAEPVPAPATEEVQPPPEEARPDSTNLAAPVPDSVPETPQPEPVVSEPVPVVETPPPEPAPETPTPTPEPSPEVPPVSPIPPTPPIPPEPEETPAPQPQPAPPSIPPVDIPIPNFGFPFNGNFPVSFPFNAAPTTDEMKSKFARWGITGHHGIDFGLPEGTEVLAVDAGKVLQSSENGDYGNSVTIQHPWGQSLYAHLKETKVTEDQEVNTGDVVGISGQTGAAFGPHLHFGIKPNHPNEANGFLGFIDPTQYLPAVAKAEEGLPQIPQAPQIPQPEIPPAPGLSLDALRQKANQARTDQRKDRLNKILQFTQIHGPVTNQDVRDLLHVSQSTATDYLKDLVDRGILKMEEKSNLTTYH